MTACVSTVIKTGTLWPGIMQSVGECHESLESKTGHGWTSHIAICENRELQWIRCIPSSMRCFLTNYLRNDLKLTGTLNNLKDLKLTRILTKLATGRPEIDPIPKVLPLRYEKMIVQGNQGQQGTSSAPPPPPTSSSQQYPAQQYPPPASHNQNPYGASSTPPPPPPNQATSNTAQQNSSGAPSWPPNQSSPGASAPSWGSQIQGQYQPQAQFPPPQQVSIY